MSNPIILIISSIIVFTLVSCGDDARFFEKNIDIVDGEWSRDTIIDFDFEIKDTSAKYHLVYTIRNTANYPYYNLYLESELVDSTGLIIDTFENEVYLFDASTGKPFGDKSSLLNSSIGDFYDGRYLCQSYYKFPRPGNYNLAIKQAMRDTRNLPEFIAVGLRIEKVN